MDNNTINQNSIAASQYPLSALPVILRRTWKTPKLTEIDYSQTNENAGPGSDDAFQAS